MLRSPILLALAVVAAFAADALRDFEVAFRRSRRPAERVETRRAALDALPAEGEDLLEALLDASATLEDECQEIERERGRFLLRYRERSRADHDLQPRPVLGPLRALQDRVAERALQLEGGVARALDDATVPLSLRRALAARGLDGSGETERTLTRRLKSRHADDAGLTLVALASTAAPEPGLEERVIHLLDHDSPTVREAAAEALVTYATPAAVEALVERLPEERWRTRLRLVHALQRLTGAGVRDNAEAWAAWWRDNAEAVRSGELPLGGGEPVAPAAEHERYHDIPIDGVSVMYVIDRSGSMKQKLSGTVTLPDGREIPDRRIFRAKRELEASLRSLPEEKQFNVVAFGEGAVSFAEEQVRATPENVEAAANWVLGLGFELATSMYDGVDLAFRLGGRPDRDVHFECAFDTLFLLTDGEPTVNTAAGLEHIRFDDPDAIRAAVRRWNAWDRVVVHTIALGDETEDVFLERLASDGGGRFVRED